MSKELEAFVRLEQSSKRYKGRKEDLDTIFTVLKRLPELEHIAKETEQVVDDYQSLGNAYLKLATEKEKQDEILRIIKECFDLNGFDELVPNSKWFESDEKQDLLKEVLL